MDFGPLDTRTTSPLLQEKHDTINCGVYALINVLRHLFPQSSTPYGHADATLWRRIFHRLLSRQPSPEDPPLGETSWKLPDSRGIQVVLAKSAGSDADLEGLEEYMKDTYRTVYQRATAAVRGLREAEGIMACLQDACTTDDEMIRRRIADVRDELKMKTDRWEQRRAKYKNATQ